MRRCRRTSRTRTWVNATMRPAATADRPTARSGSATAGARSSIAAMPSTVHGKPSGDAPGDAPGSPVGSGDAPGPVRSGDTPGPVDERPTIGIVLSEPKMLLTGGHKNTENLIALVENMGCRPVLIPPCADLAATGGP